MRTIYPFRHPVSEGRGGGRCPEIPYGPLNPLCPCHPPWVALYVCTIAVGFMVVGGFDFPRNDFARVDSSPNA